MTERILVTGATGFVGKALCRYLFAHGYRVRGVVRGDRQPLADVEYVPIGDLESVTRLEWGRLLDDVQVVIHCAALVHQMKGVADPDAYYRINTAVTASLAEAAAEAGVRRFVFLSTVKVLGEFTEPGRPFRSDAPANPQDDYARSKWLAEQALTAVGERTGMEAVILRPPLIYGPGVVGNFKSLMRLVKKGIPLPLGAVNNRRSMLAIGNLLDVFTLCIQRPEPLSGTFLVSDGKDVSTAELVSALAYSQGVRVCMLPVPVSLMRLVGWCLGRKAAVDRLCGDLQLDIQAVCDALEWRPQRTMSEELETMREDPGEQV
ncbi:MAG: NAD-dependent epimerase/dehydratase family protein [Marinobacter sp.]|nr:NAD-dependent epimerase/dehydratase family protein [Marinobacter sp.]